MAKQKKQQQPRPPEQVDAAKGYARNPGIDKQRETATYWKREAMRTRDAYDAMVTLGGTAVPDYLSALGSTMYVGYHGVSRREGSGYSMGPTGGHPEALALVRAEQRALAQRARTLRSKLDSLVGQSAEIPAEIVLSGKGIRKADTPGGPPDVADDDVADAA